MKRRITLVVDDDERRRSSFTPWLDAYQGMVGVTVESVEDIPDPDRVQEFRVRVATPPAWAPMTREEMVRLLTRTEFVSLPITVTEVDPTEVPS